MLCLCAFGMSKVHAQTPEHPIYVWTQGSIADSDPDNDNYEWHNPANWECEGNPGVPPTNAIIRINSGEPVATGPLHIYRLEMNGGWLRVGSLELENLYLFFGHLAADEAILLPGGVFEWSSGTLVGNWRIPAGVTFELTGVGPTRLYGPAYLANEGVINCQAGGLSLEPSDGPVALTNHSGGVINIPGDAHFAQWLGGSYSAIFANLRGGLVRMVGSASDVAYIDPIQFINFGELRADAGTLYAAGLVRDGCIFSGGGRIHPGGGFAGGTILVSNVVLSVGGIWIDPENPGLTVLTRGTGYLEWPGGILSGTLNIGAGSRLELVSENPKVLSSGAVLNNLGIVNWNGEGGLIASSDEPVTVNNLPGAVVNLNASGQFLGGQAFFSRFNFNNETGALISHAAGTVVDFGSWLWRQAGESRVTNAATTRFGTLYLVSGATFSGAGVHEIKSGHMVLSNSVVADETIVVLDGPTLVAADTNALLLTTNGGEFQWRSGFVNGPLSIGSNSVLRTVGDSYFSHVITYGTLINNFGSFILEEGSLYLEGGHLPVAWTNHSGSRFEIARDGPVFDSTGHSVPPFHNAAGAVFAKTDGSGIASVSGVEFINHGAISSAAGVLQLAGELSLHPGGSLTGGAEVQFVNYKATLYGTTTLDHVTFALDGPRHVYCELIGGDENAAFATKNGGMFEWRSGMLSGKFHFAPGSVARAVGAGAKDSYEAMINNAGTWYWESSSWFDAWAATSFNNLPGGVFNVISNCSFVGSWQWVCGFTNEGTLNLFPGRGMGSQWNLHFLPSSRVNLSIGSEADRQVRIEAPHRDMKLNGALTVSFTNGFVPAPGSVFMLAKYRERNGEFATTAFPVLPAGSHWRLDYGDLPSGTNNHTVSLSVERTALSPGSSTNGQYQFSFSGPPGNRCVVDATDDLKEWTPIHTNTPFTGTLQFTDPDALNHPKRFYRVRLEP